MPHSVAISATDASPFVADLENDKPEPSRYAYFMLSEWLHDAMKAAGFSQAALGRALTKELGRSIDRAAINKILKGKRGIQGDELLAVEKLTGWEAPKEIQVPLKGRVGAGEVVIAIADEDHEFVAAPAQTKPGTVAVEVSGDSMFPAYEPGHLIYYSKLLPPGDMVNRRAVIQTEDNRIFLKVLRPGTKPNTWTLQSINAKFADMPDEVVEWAAPIDWVKSRR